MSATPPPRIIGGVGSRQGSTRGTFGDEADPQEVVARIHVDRGLKSGRLDVVLLTEPDLANVVASGAAILARLANVRARAS